MNHLHQASFHILFFSASRAYSVAGRIMMSRRKLQWCSKPE